MQIFPNFENMDTSITLSLDTRRQRKDGTFPLVLRLGHKQRTTSIPLKVYLQQKDWDAKKKHVRKSHKDTQSIERLNNEIRNTRNDAMNIIQKLHDTGELSYLSITELKGKIENPAVNHSFFSYTVQLIEDLKKANRFGTARSYKGVLDVLKKYVKGKELGFQDINYQFLTLFETDHYGKGNSTNGLSVYFRAVRAIYNKAIKSGIVRKKPTHSAITKSNLHQPKNVPWSGTLSREL